MQFVKFHFDILNLEKNTFCMAEVLNCWEDHISQHLNTEFPHDPTAINEIPGVRPQDTEAHPLSTRE